MSCRRHQRLVTHGMLRRHPLQGACSLQLARCQPHSLSFHPVRVSTPPPTGSGAPTGALCKGSHKPHMQNLYPDWMWRAVERTPCHTRRPSARSRASPHGSQQRWCSEREAIGRRGRCLPAAQPHDLPYSERVASRSSTCRSPWAAQGPVGISSPCLRHGVMITPVVSTCTTFCTDRYFFTPVLPSFA